MQVIYITFFILAAYLIFAFVILRFFIPFMGFKKSPLPKNLPLEMKETICRMELEYSNPQVFLQAIYSFVLTKLDHSRFGVLRYFPRLFRRDISKIWQDGGFAHCNGINYLAFTMLANSKFFKEDDIRFKYIFLNFVPHQYLQVKVGDKWIDFDPAGAGIRGKVLGTRQSFIG
jgi:hypothetical protein